MKILSLLLALATVISCSHFQNSRAPSNSGTASKPRHLIITVHGLSGNEQTFGFFGDITKQYLTAIDPNYEVQTANFIYPTGKSERFRAYDFAMGVTNSNRDYAPKGLTHFLNEQFKDRPLTPQDRISFVAHSQGGLVTYMWFVNTIVDRTEGYKYIKNVDSIVTLGTPFWGSKIASILVDFNVTEFVASLSPESSPITAREVQDMAFSSDTINTFRKMAIALDNNPDFARELEKVPVRLVNITGMLPAKKENLFSHVNNGQEAISRVNSRVIELLYKIFTQSSISSASAKQMLEEQPSLSEMVASLKGKPINVGKEYNVVESDIAVPVPSSRWNFIYTQPKEITQDTTINSNEYKNFSHLLDRSKFLFTESAHLPFDNENTRSMAYIPKNCEKVETCDHQTYRYILEQLANCEKHQCNSEEFNGIVQRMKVINMEEHKSFQEMAGKLKSFALQINIRLKPGQLNQFPDKHFHKVRKPGKETNDFDKADFDDGTLQGKIINLKHDPKNGLSHASTDDTKIYIGDRYERHSVDIVTKAATKKDPFDYIRIHLSGRVEDSKRTDGKQYSVPIEIKLPGLPKVKINAKVQPWYSTFSELDYTKAPGAMQ